jgi:CBS domain-containing protein
MALATLPAPFGLSARASRSDPPTSSSLVDGKALSTRSSSARRRAIPTLADKRLVHLRLRPVHASEMAEEIPLVGLDTPALEAARLLATRRLPGLVVADDRGRPYAILPASQVVRFLVPSYIQDDPSLARVLNESVADHAADKLGSRTVRDVLPKDRPELAVVNHDDTVIEVAAIMARLRSPLVAVLQDKRLIGAVSASRLLQFALPAE